VSDSAPRWGISFQPILPVPELVRIARAAEVAGASYIFVADEGTDRDMYVVMTAVALATRHVVIGAQITNPFSRHPVATAAAFASLEELAPGRIIVGLGVGGIRVFDPMAIKPERPFTALRETVEAVDLLLAGEEVTYHGEIHLERARIPWSPRRLPILIAGRGPRVEEYAIENADWLLVSGKPIVRLPELVARARSGRKPGPARACVAWSVHVAWTHEMVEAIRPHLTFPAVNMPPDVRALLGIGDDVADRIREVTVREGWEAASNLVPDSVLEGLAVIGERDSVVEQLDAVRRTASPDLLVIPIGDYARAEEIIAGVAPIAHAAGFAPADPNFAEPPRSRPLRRLNPQALEAVR
jgi:5,10-methylenetetrahydromethanopterin reductase